jgi:hypothetical protein
VIPPLLSLVAFELTLLGLTGSTVLDTGVASHRRLLINNPDFSFVSVSSFYEPAIFPAKDTKTKSSDADRSGKRCFFSSRSDAR